MPGEAMAGLAIACIATSDLEGYLPSPYTSTFGLGT